MRPSKVKRSFPERPSDEKRRESLSLSTAPELEASMSSLASVADSAVSASSAECISKPAPSAPAGRLFKTSSRGPNESWSRVSGRPPSEKLPTLPFAPTRAGCCGVEGAACARGVISCKSVSARLSSSANRSRSSDALCCSPPGAGGSDFNATARAASDVVGDEGVADCEESDGVGDDAPGFPGASGAPKASSTESVLSKMDISAILSSCSPSLSSEATVVDESWAVVEGGTVITVIDRSTSRSPESSERGSKRSSPAATALSPAPSLPCAEPARSVSLPASPQSEELDAEADSTPSINAELRSSAIC
mmetsp:Transcript_24148/g.61747  ORF Transcript_24148/g.61747 Transcript_24148/m.61747 type:complete len:308 (+) Transcript_24148:1357-2280(+)